MARPAFLMEVLQTLARGGLVRFTWADGTVELIDSNLQSRPVDSRTYQALIRRPDLNRTQRGSVENKNLIIEWRQEKK
jgi:hypothetical protein